MNPHPRIRKAAKWAGLVITTVLITLSAYSCHEPVAAWIGGWQALTLDRGQFELIFRPDQRLIAPITFKRGIEAYTGMPNLTWPRWGFDSYERVAYLDLPPHWLAAIAALPTALLWWRDRRRRGACECPKCHYDRTGLPANANCPECGTPNQLPAPPPPRPKASS